MSDGERTACVACRPGYTSLAGSGSCLYVKCGLGYRTTTMNTCVFTGCPLGTAVLPTESTANGRECRRCDPGQYASAGLICLACPSGGETSM